VLFCGQVVIGNRWSDIARITNARTENMVKNRFNSRARMRWLERKKTEGFHSAAEFSAHSNLDVLVRRVHRLAVLRSARASGQEVTTDLSTSAEDASLRASQILRGLLEQLGLPLPEGIADTATTVMRDAGPSRPRGSSRSSASDPIDPEAAQVDAILADMKVTVALVAAATAAGADPTGESARALTNPQVVARLNAAVSLDEFRRVMVADEPSSLASSSLASSSSTVNTDLLRQRIQGLVDRLKATVPIPDTAIRAYVQANLTRIVAPDGFMAQARAAAVATTRAQSHRRLVDQQSTQAAVVAASDGPSPPRLHVLPPVLGDAGHSLHGPIATSLTLLSRAMLVGRLPDPFKDVPTSVVPAVAAQATRLILFAGCDSIPHHTAVIDSGHSFAPAPWTTEERALGMSVRKAVEARVPPGPSFSEALAEARVASDPLAASVVAQGRLSGPCVQDVGRQTFVRVVCRLLALAHEVSVAVGGSLRESDGLPMVSLARRETSGKADNVPPPNTPGRDTFLRARAIRVARLIESACDSEPSDPVAPPTDVSPSDVARSKALEPLLRRAHEDPHSSPVLACAIGRALLSTSIKRSLQGLRGMAVLLASLGVGGGMRTGRFCVVSGRVTSVSDVDDDCDTMTSVSPMSHEVSHDKSESRVGDRWRSDGSTPTKEFHPSSKCLTLHPPEAPAPITWWGWPPKEDRHSLHPPLAEAIAPSAPPLASGGHVSDAAYSLRHRPKPRGHWQRLEEGATPVSDDDDDDDDVMEHDQHSRKHLPHGPTFPWGSWKPSEPSPSGFPSWSS
jgi:hypothetical protein